MKGKILVVVSKEITEEVLNYYANDLKLPHIMCVSPKKYNKPKSFKNIIFKTDKDFLDRNLYNCIDKTERPNWYYQQFLKYKIILNLDYEFVHIVDGDSYVREEILFSKNIYFSEKEIEVNYSTFIEEITNENIFSKKNYITNQMCFNKKWLEEFIGSLDLNLDNWIESFCKVLKDSKNTWFSEYQCYANYVLLNKSITEKKIKVFRRFDLINKNYTAGLKKYHVLAVEKQHKTGVLRHVRAKLYYWLNLNLG